MWVNVSWLLYTALQLNVQSSIVFFCVLWIRTWKTPPQATTHRVYVFCIFYYAEEVHKFCIQTSWSEIVFFSLMILAQWRSKKKNNEYIHGSIISWWSCCYYTVRWHFSSVAYIRWFYAPLEYIWPRKTSFFLQVCFTRNLLYVKLLQWHPLPQLEPLLVV